MTMTMCITIAIGIVKKVIIHNLFDCINYLTVAWFFLNIHLYIMFMYGSTSLTYIFKKKKPKPLCPYIAYMYIVHTFISLSYHFTFDLGHF